MPETLDKLTSFLSEHLSHSEDWALALVLAIAGFWMLAYFSRLNTLPKNTKAFPPLDAETLRLLKDLETKAREFDAFVAEKIFEEGREGYLSSDEHWPSTGTSSDVPAPPARPRLRLIEGLKKD